MFLVGIGFISGVGKDFFIVVDVGVGITVGILVGIIFFSGVLIESGQSSGFLRTGVGVFLII